MQRYNILIPKFCQLVYFLRTKIKTYSHIVEQKKDKLHKMYLDKMARL